MRWVAPYTTTVALPSVLRALAGRERTAGANAQLGYALAFVAGAANAGGFLAVHQYTSHMTGIVSAMADNLVIGGVNVAAAGIGAVLDLLGAATSAILINWARRHRLRSEYALPLVLEALLLLLFGLVGANLATHIWLFVSMTVMLLCFIMGLQNAIVTKISQATIRTTHVTGMITDIGIELGKLVYVNWDKSNAAQPIVRADRHKLRAQSTLLAMFFAGGIIGAFGFSRAGYIATVPLSILLLSFAIWPLVDDLAALRR